MNEYFTNPFLSLSLLILILTYAIYKVYMFSRRRNKIKPVSENRKTVFCKPPRFTYEFSNGLTATQEEVTLEELFAIGDILINKVDLPGFENMNVKNMFGILNDAGTRNGFLSIILKSQNGVNDFNFRLSEITKVIEDFFFLNPTAKVASSVLKIASDFQSAKGLIKTDQKIGNVSTN